MAVFMDNVYAYSTTSSGVSVIDIPTNTIYYHVSIPSTCRCIYSDNDYVFVGTEAGIYRFDILTPYDLYHYAYYPFISSNKVNEIKGNSEFLIICTESGINIDRRKVRYITKSDYIQAKSCIVTPTTNQFYYVVYDEELSYYNISRIDVNNSNWSTADIIYEQDEDFLLYINTINDICVTERTSTDNSSNTIFVAGKDTVVIYDEGTNEHITISGIGNNNNYTSIMSSSGSNINEGLIYLTSSGINNEFVIFDISSNGVVDLYSYYVSGKSGDYLLNNDIDSFYTY